jgi:diguanylate cyclase (GGDEF)-like protein
MHQASLSSARSGHKAAVMFLDLDLFKQLNDNFGHDVGDLLLKQVALRLQACLREGDSVSRMGGDEFVVLLEALSPVTLEAATQVQRVAQKMLAALQQPCTLRDIQHLCTASVGMVLFSGNEPTSEALLKMADSAMYQAKATGRNLSRFFDPALQAAIPPLTGC